MAEPTNLISDALLGKSGSSPAALPTTPTATPVTLPPVVPVEAIKPEPLTLAKEATLVPTVAPETQVAMSVTPAPVSPSIPSATPVVGSAVVPGVSSVKPPAVVADGSRRTFLIILAAVVVGAILLAGGAFWLWQRLSTPVVEPEPSSSAQATVKIATPEEVAGLVVVPTAKAEFGAMAQAYPNAKAYALENSIIKGNLYYDEDVATGELVYFLKIQGGEKTDRSLVMWLVDQEGSYSLVDSISYEEEGAAKYGFAVYRVPKADLPYVGVTLSYETATWDVAPNEPTEKVIDAQL